MISALTNNKLRLSVSVSNSSYFTLISGFWLAACSVVILIEKGLDTGRSVTHHVL